MTTLTVEDVSAVLITLVAGDMTLEEAIADILRMAEDANARVSWDGAKDD